MNIDSSTLPPEMWACIFSFADPKSLESASRVCKRWRPEALRILENRAKLAVSAITITSAVWGDPYDEKGAEIASWPWKQVFVDMQRMPSLMLVRVPKISITAMGALLQEKKGVGYWFIWDQISEELRSKVEEPCWIAMTTDVLPEGRGKLYDKQKSLAEHSKGYTMPKLREAIACIFAKHLQDSTHLYSERPLTFTRCQEIIDRNCTAVGRFSPRGLVVTSIRYITDYGSIGVAALRKF